MLVAPQARADAPDQAYAQALFDEALRLIDQGRYAEACPKLAESQRLDPGGGTLLNLGYCREKEGKLATAWAVYGQALSQAIKDGRKDREDTARKRVTELEPVLAKIVIRVPAEVARLQGLEVTLDGVRVGSAAWGMPTPIDAGGHVVTASALGKHEWQQAVQVERDRQVVDLAVPVLGDAPEEGRDAAPPKPSPLRTVGLVVGGVGAAGLLVGTIGGIAAVARRGDSNAQCPNEMCTAQGVAANEDAKAVAWVANVGFAVGIVGLGVGAMLFFVGKPQSQKLAIVPVVGPGAAGLAGRF